MPDTPRTRPELQALFADNLVGAISAQDLRDFVASVKLISEVGGIQTREQYGPAEAGAYAKTWDAADDRTGGTVTITLQGTPQAGTVVLVYVDRVLWVHGKDYTITGNTITFEAGAHPYSDEVVTVLYYPNA